jgi:hypothetical protein
MFSSFKRNIQDVLKRLLADVQASAGSALASRVAHQIIATYEDASLALEESMKSVRAAVSKEQKEISRCLAPHIQTKLIPAYCAASRARGKGCVAKQRVSISRL